MNKAENKLFFLLCIYRRRCEPSLAGSVFMQDFLFQKKVSRT